MANDQKISADPSYIPTANDYFPIIDATGPTNKRITTANAHFVYSNQSVTNQGAGFATDTYLVGSNITMPTGAPLVGTTYRLTFSVTKTAVGTATPIIILRFGTLTTTSDAAILTFTFGAGTAAIDTGVFEVLATFRTVGSGTTAVLQGLAHLDNNATTGIASTSKAVAVTSSGFNSTTANAVMGCSYNAGTSAVHTVQLVRAELSL